MKWEDQGVLIDLKVHGEKNSVIRVLTENHGLCAGLVRGGQTKQYRSSLQPGAQLNVDWFARLPEHLGTFRVDVKKGRSMLFMGEKLNLYAFNSVCSMILLFLPDREPERELYFKTIDVIEEIDRGTLWLKNYVEWEILFLQEIGFGLQLSRCAVTGSEKNLSHVSPKSGMAVCEKIAEPWKEKLLRLPEFLISSDKYSQIKVSDALDGLALSGHFLKNWVLPELNIRSLPTARTAFIDELVSF